MITWFTLGPRIQRMKKRAKKDITSIEQSEQSQQSINHQYHAMKKQSNENAFLLFVVKVYHFLSLSYIPIPAEDGVQEISC